MGHTRGYRPLDGRTLRRYVRPVPSLEGGVPRVRTRVYNLVSIIQVYVYTRDVRTYEGSVTRGTDGSWPFHREPLSRRSGSCTATAGYSCALARRGETLVSSCCDLCTLRAASLHSPGPSLRSAWLPQRSSASYSPIHKIGAETSSLGTLRLEHPSPWFSSESRDGVG